jgi:hypothetical protein
MFRRLAFRWFRWIRRRAIRRRLQEGSQPVSGGLARTERATTDEVAMHVNTRLAALLRPDSPRFEPQ